MKQPKKILIVPGFLEFAWLPRFFLFRREIRQVLPKTQVKIMNFRWIRQQLSDCSLKTQAVIPTQKPEIVVGHSYGAEVAVRALAGVSKTDQPKKLILCSPSNNWAEDVREDKANWHLKFVRADILDNFSLIELAQRIHCPVEVLAAKPEMTDKNFRERVKHVASLLTVNKKPIIINSKKTHQNNFADKAYRLAIIEAIKD